MKTKEVAEHLLEVFADLGIPCVLQSDNGREFANQVIEELVGMWPDCHIVHGKPRHSQSQGSVERANQDIENKLASWMKDNNSTKWSEGLKIVQFQKNRCFHSGIGRSPYEALYGVKCRDGLNNLPVSITNIKSIRTEEELETLLSSSNDTEDKVEEDSHPSNNFVPDEKSTVTEEEMAAQQLSDLIENATLVMLPDNTHRPVVFADNTETPILLELNTETPVLPENNTETPVSLEVNNRTSVLFKEQAMALLSTETTENALNESLPQKCLLCSDENVCDHCQNKNNIKAIRDSCQESLKRQAQKMLQTSRKKFKPGAVGMSVRVPIPDVDRSRSDHRNILGVIMSVEDEFYRIGTVHGVLKQLYSRNEFEICKQQFLKLENVKTDTEITLRSAAGKFSVSGSTQGYVRCHCKKSCANKKCKCLASGYTCNSKCHNSATCSNK
ncbi:uncharacterized protein LOC116164310 [Photinus pyralis]|uniref:uncharacterized protein LOC116164310 n=1 Tax=Photinus pyralis TaxID=7054 RepID=UPI0012672E83|nr:uncharacterized protein LOC116164310 [Photinus pyralis]